MGTVSTSRHTRFTLSISVIILLFIYQFLLVVPAKAEPAHPDQQALTLALNAFNRLWLHNDRPVAEGLVARSWLWGNKPLKAGLEPYTESPDGRRMVLYWDKSRMELNDPAANPDSPWYVSNGLLVKEMVSGQAQTGNFNFLAINPADVPVAGDPASANPKAPTYASFSGVASLNNDRRTRNTLGSAVTAEIDKAGHAIFNPIYSSYNVKNSFFEPTLGHNIPDVFVDYFNSSGPVYRDGQLVNERLFDWVFAAGLPITEPYWVKTIIGGKEMPVLVQLFERRVLTYNPSNPPGWRVEMGNVGQHYYSWRYGTTPEVTDIVPLPASLQARFYNSTEGDKLLEIGNAFLKRTVLFGKYGGAYSTSLKNQLTGNEYLVETHREFGLLLSRELADEPEYIVELNSSEFRATSFEVVKQTSQEVIARVRFAGNFEGNPLSLDLFYQVTSNGSFTRKWLEIEPFTAPGWVIKRVMLEDWLPADSLQPVAPTQRYLETFNKPNYGESFRLGRINSENPEERYTFAETSTAVAGHLNGQEGFFFFEESIFGEEHFNVSEGLQVWNTDFVEPTNKFSSGRSVVGIYSGSPELGFKRYSEYLYDHYAVIKGKRDPVWFSTWYPYEHEINEKLLLDVIDRMDAAGFYDTLHIDAGWQAGAPLQINPDRFPNGLAPVVDRLEASNLTLGLWINPFSRSYEALEGYTEFAEKHPEWVDWDDSQKRFCPLSGAGDYVRTRLLEIAQNWPLEAIYWDGRDWFINNCQSADKRWRTPDEEKHLMWKYYAELLQELHAIRPELRVVLWSAPANVHWLSVTDQIQLSDIDTPPILESELVRRQQMYSATYEFPYYAIWGDWYGVSYRRHWPDGLAQPLDKLKFAVVSVIGNGATQAGGSIDLSKATPEYTGFLKKLFDWRKQFARYFTQYQHILHFPDGSGVDGEAHIIKGQGFILLFNQTGDAKEVKLPIDEAGLELSPAETYIINDWSDFTVRRYLAKARPGENVTVTVPAAGYLVIGINT